MHSANPWEKHPISELCVPVQSGSGLQSETISVAASLYALVMT